MIMKALLLTLLWLISTLSLAEEVKPEGDANLWEKAKRIGGEVWNGKSKESSSSRDNPDKKNSDKEQSEPKSSDENSSESAGSTEESPSNKEVAIQPEVRDSAKNRTDSEVSLFYIPFSTGVVLPSKTGFSATWILSSTSSLEAEYLSGSYGLSFSKLDIATFSEKIISAKYRWYTGNSFNLFLGGGERKYKFSVGNDLLAFATNQPFSSFPSLVVENQVMVLGLGNRWQYDNGFTLGFDWLELIIPVGKGRIENSTLDNFKDEKDRDNTEKFLKLLRYAPTVTVLKIALGYTF
jgi:hypothetical protein